MMTPILIYLILVPANPGTAGAARDVYVRFQMLEPAGSRYHVRLGGYIHRSPWYLPRALWPEGADKNPERRVAAGEFTPWFNFGRHAGELLHGRLNRSGGIAEFPNVTADFIAGPPSEKRRVVIEIATAPDEGSVVKRFEETYRGSLTSFLISPDPRRDAESLETASQMTARRLEWAREASKGLRSPPERIIIQTSFWSPQREELNLREAEVLRLLGFNVVGNQMEEVRKKYSFRLPGHTHQVRLGPGATREEIDGLMKKQAGRSRVSPAAGVPFGFSDEVCCRPRIGDDPLALEHFHRWLAGKNISPGILGVQDLQAVRPIETPEELREREKEAPAAARRVFYYTSRFRQAAATERIRWHTEAFHRYFGNGPLTSTLVADHPYFSGTGLGMGMSPNPAWGGYPLAADWFDLARSRAVDLAGIEDWMGLQYMYGPNFTWEGFQLMGFQASIFRSGSRGSLPIIAWITPGDETNLRLKTASALCQGAKHFFYWTYGPTATSTENYWSDLRGAYGGIAAMTRQLARAEHIIFPGKNRKTRLALLYSISSDLWQPLGYIHMLERRVTYLALVHEQYLVDLITEEDIESGRLEEYDCLYVTDPCIREKTVPLIEDWVQAGGHLYGSCAAGSRNEFNEPAPGLSAVFGIRPAVEVTVRPGPYHIRGALNGMEPLDRVILREPSLRFGAMGVKVKFSPTSARISGEFGDGTPAVVENIQGKGRALYVGTCPAISYARDAGFVPRELKERWPGAQRTFICGVAETRGVPRLLRLARPVVEVGIYDSPAGTAVILANFTYQPIQGLRLTVPLPGPCSTVRSVEQGRLQFSLHGESRNREGPVQEATVEFDLDLNDIILFEY